jgi:hypothetical protein
MQALKGIVKRTPFQPFRLKMSDDTSYDVLHPEMLAFYKEYVIVPIYDDDDDASEEPLPTRPVHCSYLHIVGTEDLKSHGGHNRRSA